MTDGSRGKGSADSMQASFSGRTVEGVVGQDEACWRSSAPLPSRWELFEIQRKLRTHVGDQVLMSAPCRGESVGSHGNTKRLA